MVSIFWSEPNFQCASACCGVLRPAAACFKTPTNRPQNQVLRHAAAFCGMLRHASTVGACWGAWRGAGRSLTKKKCSSTPFSQKSPRAHHVLAMGGWQLAVGEWRLVAVGGGWRRLVFGDWWLMPVGSGWRLAVGRRWRLAVGGG